MASPPKKECKNLMNARFLPEIRIPFDQYPCNRYAVVFSFDKMAKNPNFLYLMGKLEIRV